MKRQASHEIKLAYVWYRMRSGESAVGVAPVRPDTRRVEIGH